MNGCFFSLKRMSKIKTTDNTDTETEDQRIIIILNEITKQISQLTEIITLLNGRINDLENEVSLLKTQLT